MSTATSKFRPAQWGLMLAAAYMATFAVIALWPPPALDISPVPDRQVQYHPAPGNR